MIAWSIAAHIALFAFMVFMPASWRGAIDEGPRTVMTISLGGAPGPRNGGLTTMGGRTVQAPPPSSRSRSVRDAARAEDAGDGAADEERAAAEATAAGGAEGSDSANAVDGPAAGRIDARRYRRARPGLRVDLRRRRRRPACSSTSANFCCPEYLAQMVTLIQRNWQSNQGVAGSDAR